MKKNKYGNKKTEIDGIVFDSKLESEYYTYLKNQLKMGEIKDFSLQPKYELQPSFKKNNKTILAINYIADFVVLHNDGTLEVIDVKGMPPTADFLIKKKLFEFKYKNLTLKVLKKVQKYGGWIELSEYNKRKRAEKK